MLVLTRKENESVIIAGEILVTICRIDGNQVRLGIDAPADIPILREEICMRKREPFLSEKIRLVAQ